MIFTKYGRNCIIFHIFKINKAAAGFPAAASLFYMYLLIFFEMYLFVYSTALEPASALISAAASAWISGKTLSMGSISLPFLCLSR